MIPSSIPKHIAIVMDGNGRWATQRRRPRVFGHIRGSSRVKLVVREADRLGVKALTLFAFSTENWKRPDSELRVLWSLMKKFLLREVEDLARKNIRLRVIGEKDRLSDDVRAVVSQVETRLAGNTGLQLNIAVSYGSRRELTVAAKAFAADCLNGKAKPEDLTEEFFSRYLWTRELGELSDVDLVIRTSGELRTSNFLLWQAAYAEYYFTDLCWPDFGAEHLKQAIESYSARDRRFGGIRPGGGSV